MRSYFKVKNLTIAGALFLTISTTDTASAASATGTLTVSANVPSVCAVTSVNDIAFGDYNPASGTSIDGEGSFTFRCLEGISYNLYITGERQMSGASASNLNYELYTDDAKTNVWPSSNPSSENGVTTDADPITRNVYGRIPAGQYVPAGSYINTVSVVVAF